MTEMRWNSRLCDAQGVWVLAIWFMTDQHFFTFGRSFALIRRVDNNDNNLNDHDLAIRWTQDYKNRLINAQDDSSLPLIVFALFILVTLTIFCATFNRHVRAKRHWRRPAEELNFILADRDDRGDDCYTTFRFRNISKRRDANHFPGTILQKQ